MSSLSALQALHTRVKEESQLVEQRIAASRPLISTQQRLLDNKSTTAAAFSLNKEEAALRDGVIHAIGQLYIHYTSAANSRSASATAATAAIETQESRRDDSAAAAAALNSNAFSAPSTPAGSPASSNRAAAAAASSTFATPLGSPVGASNVSAAPTPTGRSGTPPPPNSAAVTPSSRSSSVHGMVGVSRPPPPPVKGGMLLNYGLPSMLRSFKLQYVVVETDVVRWYKSQEAYASGPGAALGSIPLHTIQKNSRGSVIKQVAACWPFISPTECPRATDPKVHYFGLQYLDEKGALQFLTLGAATAEEKKEWVMHLAQLVMLHLPMDVHNLFQGPMCIDMYQNIPPHHVKTVLDGEAPKF